MLNFRSPPPSRRGYTLVELLVVIAIIAVLAGLILAGVQKVRFQGQVVTVRADIDGLQQAIGQFKAKFNNRLPPCDGQGAPYNGTTVLRGTFRLCSEYPSPATDSWPEVAYLQSIFGRMNRGTTAMDGGNGLLLEADTANPKFIKYGAGTPNTYAPTTFNGLPVTAIDGPILLDPNQALVFFLSGGRPMNYLGFATSPTQPFTPPKANTPNQRLQGMPFLDFKSDRLQTPLAWFTERSSAFDALPSPPVPTFASSFVKRWEGTPADTIATAPNVAGVSNEPWYLDIWKTPFLYMAASGVGSGGDYPYKPGSTTPVVPATPILIGPWGGKYSGFNRTTTNQLPSPAAYTTAPYIFPYIGPLAFKDSAVKWTNHNGFQIISGGPNGSTVRNDRTWGFGYSTDGIGPFGGGDFDGAKGAGGDDYSNFRKVFHGAPD